MKTKKRSKHKKWITIGIIAIVLVGVAIPSYMRPKTTNFERVEAKTGDITTYYSFSGNVETKSRQTVMSETLMQISSIKVEEGDIVKEGDVLIETSTADEIKSKIDGIITKVNIEENAQVMAGVKLIDIVDNNNLEINVKVDEYDISALAVGKETTVKIGAVDKEVSGEVESMSEEGQTVNGVTYFTAKIDLEKDSSIKIGMSAEVTLISDQVKSVVTVPMTAIQFDDSNNPYVLKEDEQGNAVRTDITTGINDGTTVEVISGVSDGETILYSKVTSTSSGMGFGGGARNNTTGGGDN
ncbi:MAG: transporter [Herbinix sp.]|jgi:HlyD family secretion protein|nr:transporter [Herbinix sp.]